ncbi:haloacid dehalogenase [Enterococcus florum]|uniref:Haloacid dehalogenase n=1 Tax=Enterococcus florum TaxID=2480627 RepID=A0A4P5PCR7_9ENTE|nr:Cof-type HAD-IIB family hydrolase [Enterococcus florum]GCF95646.1 haloacid dehalogenase [Enterococcus florum]
MKLVAVDLDGTLLDPEGQVSKENAHALQEFDSQGGIVVLATGRSILSAKKVFAQLQLSGYTLASNGAYVARVEKGEVKEILKSYVISKDTVQTSLRLAMNAAVTVVASRETQDDRIFFEKESSSVDSPYYAQFNLKDSSAEELMRQIESGEISYFKLAFTDSDTSKLVKLRAQLEKHKINSSYSDKYWLEVMSDGVNKGAALSFLTHYLSVDLDDVLAFGDQENDLEMLKTSGFAVAMENAAPAVRKTANKITKSNEESGVAYVLNEYISE